MVTSMEMVTRSVILFNGVEYKTAIETIILIFPPTGLRFKSHRCQSPVSA